MALTKAQVLALYLATVDPATVTTRLEQMYNLLTAGQKTTVWNTIKVDLLAILNANKARIQAEQASRNARFVIVTAEVDSSITDVTATVP